jgi:hypothetical protein
MLRPDLGCTRSIPRIPAGLSGYTVVSAFQAEDSLVGPIFSAKPCFVQGVFDIFINVPEILYFFLIVCLTSVEEYVK